MDFQKLATEYNELPWPINKSVDFIYPEINLSHKGRMWRDVNLRDIPTFLGNILNHAIEGAEYIEFYLRLNSYRGNVFTFDVEIFDLIRGHAHTPNLPQQLVVTWLNAYAQSVQHKKEKNNLPLRLAAHKDGLFWELPPFYKNKSSGYLKDYLDDNNYYT